jgi:hypothetical protein
MKKLFTLVALLAIFLGANAEWKESYKIDYSTHTGFPFYVMGYVPEWVDGIMTDYGSEYRYETQANLDGDGDGKWKDGESSVGTVSTEGGTEYQKVTGANPYWHQYFIADHIDTPTYGKCRVKALVKASEACTINVNLGWGWGQGEQASASVQIPQSDEFQEVEWSYNNIGGASCNLVAQPGTAAAVIEWKSLTVEVWEKEGGRPKEWVEAVVNGDAEKTWEELGLANVDFKDVDNTIKVGAWAKVKGENLNDDGGWDPFPATIEEDADKPGNHVFVVHGAAADTEGDASAWDNQFWIMSEKELTVGAQYKVHFRYKASEEAGTNTQEHSCQPSDYLHYEAIGDINFTTAWQEFDGTFTVKSPSAGGPAYKTIYSIAFNLNAKNKNAVDFYFDDLSIKYLKLDEGFFVTGINAGNEAAEYDYDAAIPFTDEDEDGEYIAIVGEEGNADSYVSEVMISTVRGDDVQFMANTLGVEGSIKNNPEEWMDYTASSNTKLKLPGLGVWKIYLDTNYFSLAFEMIEGTEKQPDDIVTNNTAIVVHGLERDDLKDDKNAETGAITVKEEADDPAGVNVGGEGHEGQAWDNQFFIVANRTLAKGEATVLKFKYKASKAANTTTQCHGNPGAYKHYVAIGDVTFTEEWQDFEKDFTVPDEADGMQSIAFNMAEIREACDYEITDVQWYLKDAVNTEGKTWENLIDATGAKNFYVKEGAGTEPHVFGEGAGIENVVKNAKTSAVIYNLAGQRVSNGFKGIVIKDGKKMVNK